MPDEKLNQYVIEPYRHTRTFYHTLETPWMEAKKVFYKIVEKEHPESILDVGCGTGMDSKPITAHGIKYIGIDPIEGNLELARKDNPKGDFRLGYAQEIPLKDKSVDWVYLSGVWENLPDEEEMRRAFYECLRVARKKILMLECSKRPRLMTERYMIVPMNLSLSITRIHYDNVKNKANYLWVVDLEKKI